MDSLLKAYCRSISTTRALINKRDNFKAHYKERLSKVCIECNDAVQVIQSRDTKSSFHYCDPPYFNADMGHYDGYTKQDFRDLLETLSTVKGKFLLSSYPSELLTEFTAQNDWNQKEIVQSISASRKRKKKTEVLTWNY